MWVYLRNKHVKIYWLFYKILITTCANSFYKQRFCKIYKMPDKTRISSRVHVKLVKLKRRNLLSFCTTTTYNFEVL